MLFAALSQQIRPSAISIPPASICQVVTDGVIKLLLPVLLNLVLISWGMASHGRMEQVERCKWDIYAKCWAGLVFNLVYDVVLDFFHYQLFIYKFLWFNTLHKVWAMISFTKVCLHFPAPSSYILPPSWDHSFLMSWFQIQACKQMLHHCNTFLTVPHSLDINFPNVVHILYRILIVLKLRNSDNQPVCGIKGRYFCIF